MPTFMFISFNNILTYLLNHVLICDFDTKVLLSYCYSIILTEAEAAVLLLWLPAGERLNVDLNYEPRVSTYSCRYRRLQTESRAERPVDRPR